MKSMKKIIILIGLLCIYIASFAQSQLAQKLKKGQAQTLVVYGTSISSMAPNGILWVKQVGETLNKKFNNKLKVYNSGRSGQNSEWALQNVTDSVLSKKPDAVIIEFATNDAVKRFNISVDQCKLNTMKLIAVIKETYPACEIFLHTPCGYPLGKNAESRPTMQAYNKVYEDLAKELHLIWIDESHELIRIATETGIPELRKYAGDGVHPTQKSALELIAPNVVEAILNGK